MLTYIQKDVLVFFLQDVIIPELMKKLDILGDNGVSLLTLVLICLLILNVFSQVIYEYSFDYFL